MKLLHVLDHSVPLHSGYAFRTLEILREQRRRGWDTVHLTSSKHYGSSTSDEMAEGLLFYRTEVANTGWRTRPVLEQLAVIADTRRRLDEVIDSTRPDILHAHSPCLIGIAAIRAARRRRLPVVYEMRASWEDAAVDHGTTREGSLRYRASRALETWTLERADAVTTICAGLRNDIVARGIPEAKVAVIPNAVNVKEFPLLGSPDQELQGLLGLQGSLVFGFLGSFYAYEGLDTLLDALPLILAAQPSAKLLLVGGGFEDANLREHASRLGLAHRIIFAGRVPHSQVSRYYSLVDVLVYPRKSIRLTETVTPLKPLEAMAQGKLLMASDVGGHRELIRDGETGFLFRPDSPDELAACARRVFSARNSWDAVRAAGRTYVERERNWARSVDNYEGVYGPLLERRRRA